MAAKATYGVFANQQKIFSLQRFSLIPSCSGNGISRQSPPPQGIVPAQGVEGGVAFLLRARLHDNPRIPPTVRRLTPHDIHPRRQCTHVPFGGHVPARNRLQRSASGWSSPAGMFRIRAESGGQVSDWVYETVA